MAVFVPVIPFSCPSNTRAAVTVATLIPSPTKRMTPFAFLLIGSGAKFSFNKLSPS